MPFKLNPLLKEKREHLQKRSTYAVYDLLNTNGYRFVYLTRRWRVIDAYYIHRVMSDIAIRQAKRLEHSKRNIERIENELIDLKLQRQKLNTHPNVQLNVNGQDDGATFNVVAKVKFILSNKK